MNKMIRVLIHFSEIVVGYSPSLHLQDHTVVKLAVEHTINWIPSKEFASEGAAMKANQLGISSFASAAADQRLEECNRQLQR
jgi:hypothetical protein